MDRPIYAIAGPTASGKTALGVALALRIGNAEVISCDSVQVYKGIRIATAKPSDEETRGVPHHLIDYVSPERDYTSADWARDAAKKIEEIEGRQNTVLIVGGTGFYLRTLRNPLFEGPGTDPELRARLRRILDQKGAAHLHQMVGRVDPKMARKLYPNDYVRSMRALEVYFQTGKRLSALQTERGEAPEFSNRIRLFALRPPREGLYIRINERTERHFSAGLVQEVRNLLDRGVPDDGNALGSHGYRRVCEYLRGERGLESAVEKTQQDVRNYAKRQITWFRKEPGVTWLDGFGSETDVQQTLFRLLGC